MSVLSYFARNSLVRLTSYSIGVAAAFFVTPHMLRCLGASVYGVWALISSASAYYMLLGVGGTLPVSNKIAQADARHEAAKAQRIFASALLIGTAAFLLTLVIAGLVSLMAESLSGGVVKTWVFAVSFISFSAAIGVQLLLRAAHGVLAGKMRWTTIAVTGMLRTLASCAAILLFVNEGADPESNLLRIAFIISGSFVLEALAYFALASRSVSLRFARSSFSMAEVREILSFGASILVLQIGELLRTRTQIYLVSLLLSLWHVTIFSLARQFISYMNDIILSAFGIMNPYFSGLHAKGKTEECKQTLLVSLSLSYSAASIASLGLVFYGGLFVERWIGPEYAQVQSVLAPMAVSCLFSLGDMPASGFLIGLGKQAFMARLSVLEGIFNTLCSIPALLLIGLPGIGITLLAGAVIFRVFLLPRQVCAISGIAPAAYYKNMAIAIAPTVIAQSAYYAAISAYLTPDYPVILAAGAGQTLVAGAVLFGGAFLRNRLLQPAQPAQSGESEQP